MVYDLKLENSCTHRIVDEIQQVDDDRQSLRFERPPSATRLEDIVLKVNGFEINPEDPTYSYTLVRDEARASLDGFGESTRVWKKILFANKLKAIDDLFQITYYTDVAFCNRCHDLRIENDFRYTTATGKPITVTGQQKLLQDLKKWMYTILGSNTFHEYIGTTIYLLIGQKIVNPEMMRLKITQEINSTLNGYIQKQLNQAQIQRVSDAELLSSVLSVDVVQSSEDPSLFNVNVVVQNKTFGVAEISQPIKVLPSIDRSSLSLPSNRRPGSLTARDANNSQITELPPSPVQNFRNI